jgi:hypothetical protein
VSKRSTGEEEPPPRDWNAWPAWGSIDFIQALLLLLPDPSAWQERTPNPDHVQDFLEPRHRMGTRLRTVPYKPPEHRRSTPLPYLTDNSLCTNFLQHSPIGTLGRRTTPSEGKGSQTHALVSGPIRNQTRHPKLQSRAWLFGHTTVWTKSLVALGIAPGQGWV